MGRTRHLAVAALLVAAALVPAQPAAAATAQLFVATNGNDNDNGTQASPYRTIQKALNTAGAGTTITVEPGTYTGDLRTKHVGNATAPIVLRSATPHTANIVGNLNISHDYTRLQNFEMTGPKVAFAIDLSSSHVVIQGNKIHGQHKFQPTNDGGAGMEVATNNYATDLADITIDSNEVYDIGPGPGSDQLIQGIYVDIKCPGCKITNNLVHGITDFGIHSYHKPNGWVVANNTVFNNGRGILTGPNFTVANNISLNNKSSNYDLRGTQAFVGNNLSYGTGAKKLSGVTVADPQFVNYQGNGTGNYQLKPTSPGVDHGNTAKAPSLDIVGEPRPQGPSADIGAYELPK